jgi:Tol biopolymer transport system component
MYRRAITLAVFSLAAAGSAGGQCTQSPSPQDMGTFPVKSGHIAFDSRNTSTEASSLYLFNFKTLQLQALGPAWGILSARNPHFSPDGAWLTFAGIQNNRWHVFVWRVGSTAPPIDMTLAAPTHRNEDPKFSPDGRFIVFKGDGAISLMTLGRDHGGNLLPLRFQSWTTGGSLNCSILEASAPVLNVDSSKAYYFRGAPNTKCTASHIYYSSPLGYVESRIASTNTSVEYYPILRNDGVLFFVGHVKVPPSSYDQIYMKVGTSAPASLAINACSAENADPTPVLDSGLIFSSTRDNGQYQLYYGDIASGKVWNFTPLLSSPGVPAPTDQLQGASG